MAKERGLGPGFDAARAQSLIAGQFAGAIVPALIDYIRIPNKSPAFDPDWAAHGHMERAVALLAEFARERLAALGGASLEILRLPNRTPLILIDVPAFGSDEVARPEDCVLLYGHLDKQPEMTGWTAGRGPWVPHLEGERLYGRGGADDGYAMFAALAALTALHEQGVAHARCVILIEACEESGSPDLPFYVDHLQSRLGRPSLVVCLDSGCGTYDRLWLTTSLRGMVSGTLGIRVLEEGVHSGDASGVVASSFRLLRLLLSRLEEETSGRILPESLYSAIPPARLDQARAAAAVLGSSVHDKFPFVPGMAPVAADLAELVLNRTWRPQLAVTGLRGLPDLPDAGNVLLPMTAAKLSLRLPPTLDAMAAAHLLEDLLTRDPPYGAEVKFTLDGAASGWNAPALSPWLEASLDRAGRAAFGAPPAFMGEGGSIPFMAMLGEKFPAAEFVVTGVLGPHSNAHGPNEFLDLPTARRITQAIAGILADHRHRPGAAE